ncbi:MAG TPA: glycoside hydrolase, partial [Flavisolibacter sp.]|nr:glycoside hydrolase [Flavisolibacter sp.]
LSATKAKNIVFSYSTDGKNFKFLNDKIIDASFIPPWDRAVRAGIISRGEKGKVASFQHFVLEDK